MPDEYRGLAVVTGASTGIGFELARIAAERGHDLLIAADEPEIEAAARSLQGGTARRVDWVKADLSTIEGVDTLLRALEFRPVAALLANAGRGLGHAFLDQDFAAIRRVVDTNVTGTLYLLHRVGQEMRTRGTGRILITGSLYLAGHVLSANGTAPG